MTYSVLIYYQNDSYVPKALEFIINKFNKNFKINTKVDDVLVPINDFDSLQIKVIKGLNNCNTTLNADYVIIQRSLIKEGTVKYWEKLKENIKKDFWVMSERSLEEQ